MCLCLHSFLCLMEINGATNLNNITQQPQFIDVRIRVIFTFYFAKNEKIMFLETHNVSRHTLFMAKEKKKNVKRNWKAVFSLPLSSFLALRVFCFALSAIDWENLELSSVLSWKVSKGISGLSHATAYTADQVVSVLSQNQFLSDFDT